MKSRSELSRARCPAALPHSCQQPPEEGQPFSTRTPNPLRGQGTQADSCHCQQSCRISGFGCPRRTLHGDLAARLRPQAASGRLQAKRLLRAPGLSGGAGFTPQQTPLSTSWPHNTLRGWRGQASNNSIAQNRQTRSAYSAINHRHGAVQRTASV